MIERINNLVWTVAENYDFEVNLNFFNTDIKSKYKSEVLGFLYKHYNMSIVDEFLKINCKNKSNSDDILFIAEITMEHSIISKLLKERPGIIDAKRAYEKYIHYKYEKTSPKNIKDELEKAYYECKKGTRVKINGTLYSLFNEIIAADIENTSDLINFLNNLYKKYFHIYPNMPQEKEIQKIIKKAKKEEFKKVKIIPSTQKTDTELLEKFTIESAEFTNPEYDFIENAKDNRKISSSKIGNIKEKVRKYYGEEILKEREIVFLENKLCTGIHKGERLYFTNGEFKIKESEYIKSLADAAYEENLNVFKENELYYNRGIKNLEEIIKNSLLKNSEEYDNISYSGDLIVSDLWKSVKNIDNKIFKKTLKENTGEISVDILLDQSASQKERQAKVAIEAYIIAEALTNLNIKTRVMGFNNFYNYTIIRNFRNYSDSKIKNKEIFKYNASGSNRDGLAIKLMTYFIEKSDIDRKILIVLSDGKPNDEINLGLVGTIDLNVKDYVDEVAIMDSFNQVLISRLKGIYVLGVFMGNEEDLDAERKIFGKNFAYITDIKRFHFIVGLFLKSISEEFR